ncbi:MAG TPA: amidohydrolase family protein [Steroidobacteraceae bacterium]|jgi:5-methylthioadenosine/S-adenosylhomocysteine deaminase
MPPETVDLLIDARWVLPIAPDNSVLAKHAVAVADGRVVAVGPANQMAARFQAREHISRPNHALLPGFVNAHTRAATTLLRGAPVHGPRSRWMRETLSPLEQRFASPDLVRDGTRLAIAEMLRAGITCFAATDLFPEEAARVASSARIRTAIGLPVGDSPTVWAESANEYFSKAEGLWDAYRTDPWVGLYFGLGDSLSVADSTLSRLRRVADELDARVAMPVHESAAEIHDSLARFGKRPLQRLQSLGLLRPGFTAIHATQLDTADLDALSRTGVCVVTCPQSSLRLGGGMSPVALLESHGVPVGLGTDSAACTGALDVLAEARAVALFGAAAGADGNDPAAAALRMATLGGAMSLGMGSLVGSIEAGKAADFVCFDLDSLAFQPKVRVADAVLYSATRANACDVWTSGRRAVSDGRLLAFDEEEISVLARQWAERLRLETPL